MEVEIQNSDGLSASGLPIMVPPSLSLDSLQSILATCGASISTDQLQSPNSSVILQIYTALLTIPTLRDSISQFGIERKEAEKTSVEMEMQLHDAERLKDEAEKRAEEDRAAKEEVILEKNQISSQLAQVQGTLDGLQSTAESGTRKSAEVKGLLEKIQQEKRDVLEMLERERLESARRAEEIDILTVRSREARNEASRLAADLQEAKSSEGTAMFKIQSLEQEIALKSNDANWARKELEKTTSDLAQSRNEMNDEVTVLSSQLQKTTQDLEAIQAKASFLQSAYDNAIVRLEEGTREKAELRQRLAEQEGAFSSEISTQQRLNDLMEQAKESAERRMAEVEEQWETILHQHREKEEVLHFEIHQGKKLQEEMENEKQELQLALDRLAESVGIETNGNGRSGTPTGQDDSFAVRASTPSRSFMSLSGAPTLMSPTAALASRVQKSGKSFTQVYAELARTQEELRRERLESNRIGGVLEQVMVDLQERGPALVAQREECEQMSQDLKEMSTTLAKACEERDISEREAKIRRLESEANLRENRILNSQVTDLSKQVRHLTKEILLRDDPDAAARLEDDGSIIETGDSAASISDTQAVISTQLVTFGNLTDLITQNGRLLRVVRELGTKMEVEEQEYRAKLQQGENEAVAEARELISRLQDEIRAERSRLEGIRRERDMFRSMCASGSLGNQIQAQSSSGSETNAAHSILTNQYSQLQSQFEAFRSETAKDTERLKDEAYQARSEASRHALTAAKEKASRESIEERLLNAQQTHQMAKSELTELQKRFSSLQDNLIKQEKYSQNLSQDLTMAHSKEERLRNEVSNLTAEKNLHQRIAERLTEEKKSSSAEKSNLSELLRNVQGMQAELERSSGEVKRRLESQSERLEEQCKELRSRISKEEEGHRQTSMRREVETTDLKMKLDKANEDLSKAREELAVAKNSVQHLTTKNEELQKQINSKEEKLAVYERRTLSATDGVSSSGNAFQSLDREQQLQVEIADLKGELRGIQTEAEQARGHVEQFKAIAAANEEAMSQLQMAYDQYKSMTDSALAEKTSELNSLRERMEAIGNELTSAQHEASTARQEMETQSNLWKQEKRTMEDAMTELGGVEDRARSAQDIAKEEVRAQIKLTQEAHSKYEAELVAHAEDVKALVLVKESLEAARSQAIQATKGMETAQGNLASSKDSWDAQRAVYEQEIEDIKRLNIDVTSHNESLHQHLEALQSQTSEIRQAANASTADIGDASFSQSGNEELHEVIKYLRREKKIVDLQVEVREQECARLRQSVEYMQRSLDETRMQLSREREQNAGASVSAKQHEELMEKINQLSILRESNTTLRDETEKSLRKVQMLESQVESLTTELMPLREELRIKRVELEASENQLRLSQEDNKRWQGRTQSILQQYNRIDPEDLKKLQEKKEEAEKEVEEQKRLLKEKEVEVEAARADVANKQSQFDRLRAQSIDRIKSLKLELDGHQNEKGRAQARVESLEAEKAELTSKMTDLEEQLQQKIADANTAEPPSAENEASTQEAVRVAVEEAQKAWDEEKRAMEEKRQVTEKREQTHLQKAKEFNTMLKAAIKERDELKTQMTESEQKLREQWIQEHATEIEKAVNERASVPETSSAGNDDTLTALRQRISELEMDLERANALIKELQEGGAAVAVATPEVADLQQQHQAALKEQESRLSAQFTQRQKSAVEIAINKAKAAAAAEANTSGEGSQDVQEQIQARLKAFEDEKQAQLAAALESKEKELKAAYEEQLKARYEAGKEESTLRNKLILKGKDNKIEKLTNELNALKGTAIIPSGPSASTDPTAAVQRPTPARPIPSPGANVQPGPARGGPGNKGPGPARGSVRPPPGAAGGNVQKRKLEGGQPTLPGNPAAASNGANEGGGPPKRPRPAGGQISIRGGALAGNRGGRGGHT